MNGSDSAGDAREKVRAFLDALQRRDIAGLLSLLDEEVVLEDDAGARRIGREAFQDYLVGRFARSRETIADVALMASADGTRAAAEFTLSREHDDGRRSAMRGLFFALDGGTIMRVSGLPA